MIRVSKEFEQVYNNLQNTLEFEIENISFDIAAQIYDRIKELKITQTELSKNLGVSKSYISQVLNGNSNLTIKSFVKIANAIDLKPVVKMINKSDIKICKIDEVPTFLKPDLFDSDSDFDSLKIFDQGSNYGDSISEEPYNQSA